MWRLLFESYWYLFLIAVAMRRRNGVAAIQDALRKQAVKLPASGSIGDSPGLCHVMNLACVFCLRPVLCLQRSAAAALLLRQHGLPAQIVIGVKHMPFRSHAWVEVDKTIVNDKPYLREIYHELQRF